MKTTNTDARIYCGTFAKYSAGDLTGKWLILADYRNREEFLEACRDLHADERDPEIMFPDYEGFPRCWYDESEAPPAILWEFLELDEDEAEAFAEDLAEQCGVSVSPTWLAIDWEATWENLRFDYFTAKAADGDLFIFSNQ